ncbi:hypothetical protein R1sor_021114 [Riccia sorocarpa]|uniref:Uncharacterized protein n=1 Tax=Riccia sorocarpa TaxID=122646 RepID=A0ABD3GGV6_9MARC
MEVESTMNRGRDLMELESANAATTARSRSDISAALAEKLLQGWAMLNEHCPQCLTPLVRNRQRKVYCVACQQWVLSEAEAAAKSAQQEIRRLDVEQKAVTTSSAPQTTSPNSSTTSGDQSPSSPGHRADVKSNAVNLSRISLSNSRPDDGRVPEARNPKRLASGDPSGDGVARPVTVDGKDNGTSFSAIASGHFQGSVCAGQPNPASAQWKPVLGLVLQPGIKSPITDAAVYRNTLATLNEKLEGIRHLISLSLDVDQLRQLFGVLQECVQAIEVFQDVDFST